MPEFVKPIGSKLKKRGKLQDKKNLNDKTLTPILWFRIVCYPTKLKN